MIQHLEIAPSAYFHRRKKRLTAAAVSRLFNTLRSQSRRPSGNLFRVVRDETEHGRISAICFSYERPPAFLNAAANAFDRVHGFMVLVERGEYVAIIKSGLDLPASFKTEYMSRADRARVEAAVATAEAVFERLRVQSTSPSAQVLRAKTLEAANLEGSMPMGSASRYFTQAYTVRRDDGHYSATPSTGRIAQRGDRSFYEVAVAWAAAVIEQLTAGGGEVAPVIRNFARRVDLENLPHGALPILLAIDVPKLTELLLAEQPTMRLVRPQENPDQLHQLTGAEVEEVLRSLSVEFEVRRGRPDYRIKQGSRSVGSLRIGKTRIAMRQLELAAIAGLGVETMAVAVGQDEERTLLARYLDREDLFTVLFSDPALAYVEGELFRDEAMLDGGAGFLRHLRPVASLATATSEKGDFALAQADFTTHSVFRKIIDDVAASDDILVCDDLGDEWADFIGIDTQSRPPSINFYHGKHGASSLSASAFHDAVGQAQKNLGRLSLTPGAMPAKYERWALDYLSGDGTQTAIGRIVRGGPVDDVRRNIDEVRAAPATVRHVHIVTSSLSKAQVEATFNAVAAGARPPAHFVQLYWLLNIYFSACAEMGAVGFIVCRP